MCSKAETRTALTRGRADHSAVHLVSNSDLLIIHVAGIGFPHVSLSLSPIQGSFSYRDLDIYETDLDKIEMNYRTTAPNISVKVHFV